MSADEEGRLRKRRLHYHDFMQEVHSQMHEAKKAAPPRDFSKWDTHQRFDPIPPVGDAVLEQMNMLCLDEFQGGVLYRNDFLQLFIYLVAFVLYICKVYDFDEQMTTIDICIIITPPQLAV